MLESLPPADPAKISASPGLGDWLDQAGGCLLISTLLSDLLLFVSGDGAGGVRARARNFGFIRGISADSEHLWLAGNTRLYHLCNTFMSAPPADYDAVIAMRQIHFLGGGLLHDVVHDVALDGERHPVVVANTSYSALVTLDARHSFRPLWKPKQISRLVPEDRCHLNCIGVRDGAVARVSMFAATDSDGWRSAPRNAGLIVDVPSGEVVCAGLAKPHSLRWHHDRWWVLDSDSGNFGYLDEMAGRLVPIARLGGFPRGLCMIGDHAIIGTSPLHFPSNDQPPIDGFSTRHSGQYASVLRVVDLRTGCIVHTLTLPGIKGIYDIALLPGIARPLLPRFTGTDEDGQWASLPSRWTTDADTRAALA